MKRYELEDTVSMGEAWREMREDDSGEWVRFDDVVERLIELGVTIPGGFCEAVGSNACYVCGYFDYDKKSHCKLDNRTEV